MSTQMIGDMSNQGSKENSPNRKESTAEGSFDAVSPSNPDLALLLQLQ